MRYSAVRNICACEEREKLFTLCESVSYSGTMKTSVEFPHKAVNRVSMTQLCHSLAYNQKTKIIIWI